jgi:2-methylisocitrate lyase-like PEP mutase family enzyme
MIMRNQQELGNAFRDLHRRPGAFIIPNPWDLGTARVLAGLGFEALATTSSGFAFSLGKGDNTATLDENLAHARALTAAVDVPVSADLGNAFGLDLDGVADTYRQAAAAGLVGASIEDATGDRDAPIYELEAAVDRVRAAAEVTRALPFPFMLTARAENYLFGRSDLADTIRRLLAYQEAGADVLYAPGLATKEDISAAVSSIDRPLNILAGAGGMTLTVAELSAIGVKRISTGGALTRAAIGALIRAAMEMKDSGTYTFLEDAASFREINRWLDPPR